MTTEAEPILFDCPVCGLENQRKSNVRCSWCDAPFNIDDIGVIEWRDKLGIMVE